MRTIGRWIVAAGLAAGLLGTLGCGATIGDACTTAADCGNTLCINREYTPGGYCSRQCTTSTDCPAGTACIPNGAATGVNACFRLCTAAQDCRRGYDCLSSPGSGAKVCVGPPGF